MTEGPRETAWVERRHGADRRSAWRRATDQHHTRSELKLLDLLSDLSAILTDWEAEIQAHEDTLGRFPTSRTDQIVMDKERLAQVLAKYLQPPSR